MIVATLPAQISGANVFVLFDTSNYMYRGFVLRRMPSRTLSARWEDANKIAFYSYSRDLSRNSALPPIGRNCYAGFGARSPETMPRSTIACC